LEFSAKSRVSSGIEEISVGYINAHWVFHLILNIYLW
jgi:hypothetical protein